MSLVCVPKVACLTCPYRRDTPLGIWEASEYSKLVGYDDSTMGVPSLSLFLCHQSTATGAPTVCRGWLSVHRDSVAVRIAQFRGELLPESVPRRQEPLYYGSGREAMDAGMRGISSPGREARTAMDRLLARGIGVEK